MKINKTTVVLAAALMAGSAMLCAFTTMRDEPISTTTESGIVFRTNQFLKERNGTREIYLYTSGTCEMYDENKLQVRCTYSYQNREVHLLDEYGNSVYKGSVVMRRDGINISTLNLNGAIFYNKN